MSQDKAGLKNLGISFSKDTIPFTFDTGANISTVTKSTAQKMNMKFIPVDIVVGSITGGTVNAQLGISKELKTLGKLTPLLVDNFHVVITVLVTSYLYLFNSVFI